jgi:hypothetical protein
VQQQLCNEDVERVAGATPNEVASMLVKPAQKAATDPKRRWSSQRLAVSRGVPRCACFYFLSRLLRGQFWPGRTR